MKGVIRVSPKKATAVVVKKEEETDWDDCIPDEVLQGLSEDELLQGFSGGAQAREPEVAAGCGSQGYPADLHSACHVKLEAEDGVEPLPDAHYGLLGSIRDWVEPHGSLGDLPEEVLRMVLVHLPAEDLYCSACLVCRRWRDVVRDPMVRQTSLPTELGLWKELCTLSVFTKAPFHSSSCPGRRCTSASE